MTTSHSSDNLTRVKGAKQEQMEALDSKHEVGPALVICLQVCTLQKRKSEDMLQCPRLELCDVFWVCSNARTPQAVLLTDADSDP